MASYRDHRIDCRGDWILENDFTKTISLKSDYKRWRSILKYHCNDRQLSATVDWRRTKPAQEKRCSGRYDCFLHTVYSNGTSQILWRTLRRTLRPSRDHGPVDSGGAPIEGLNERLAKVSRWVCLLQPKQNQNQRWQNKHFKCWANLPAKQRTLNVWTPNNTLPSFFEFQRIRFDAHCLLLSVVYAIKFRA